MPRAGSAPLMSIDTQTPTKTRGRSMRLEMLQLARLAPKMLGESASLVRDFLLRQMTADGGARDRAGRADLYYTIFALAGLEAVMVTKDELRAAAGERLSPWVNSFGDGEGLDFIHLGALARCSSSPFVERGANFDTARLLARIEEFR